MIIKLQNGNILKLSKEESDYLNWRKLSPEQKRQIRINKAKAYLNSGPNITNFWEAFQTYIGNRDPENSNLNTGEAPSPGWGKQGVTGLHKMIAKLPEAKLTLLAPLAGRSRAAAIIKDKNIVEALKHRDEVYRRWASLYKQEHDPTPTTFRTNPAKIKRLESNVANSNARTLAGGKANAGGSYSSKSHTIRVTTSNNVSAKNLEDIAFHEGIHSYGLGESPSYIWKSKYLNFPEGTNPYFLDPREIATHGIQQGQNLGIKVGQAYPGKEAMIKMIENRPEGLGFGGVPMILYNNAKTNSDYRRLWSLLNGTFKNGGVIKAANARKWKHTNGGLLGHTSKADFEVRLEEVAGFKNGGNLKFLLYGGNTANLISGIASVAMNAYSASQAQKAADLKAESLDKSLEVNQKDLLNKYLLEELEKMNNETLPDGVHASPIYNRYIAELRALKRVLADILKIKSLNELEKTNLLAQATLLKNDAIAGGLQTLGGIAINYLNNKSSNKNTPPSTTTSYVLPKLTTSTWTPSTTLSTSLGLYSTPLTDSNKFWNK